MSAEVGIQKFSFPFSCSARQDEASQPGRIRVKASERRGLPENPVTRPPSAVALVGILAGSGNPAGDAPDAPDEDESRAPRSAVLSRRSVFEKLAAEAEDQRPTAKRQLSTESASRSIAVVKKSAVRAEEPQRNLKAKAEVAPRGAAAATTAGRRRRRKDLFANSDIFHRLDSHVIRVGAEVTNARVTRAHFEGNTKKPQNPKLSGMRSNPGNNPLLLMFALQLREKRVHDVAAIVLNIASVAKSDLEKIRAIWVWLCHNIGEGKPVSAELGSISHFAVGNITARAFPIYRVRHQRLPGTIGEAVLAGGSHRDRSRSLLRLLGSLYANVQVTTSCDNRVLRCGGPLSKLKSPIPGLELKRLDANRLT